MSRAIFHFAADSHLTHQGKFALQALAGEQTMADLHRRPCRRLETKERATRLSCGALIEGGERVAGAARVLEHEVLSEHGLFRSGLEQAGLDQERRALRLRVDSLSWKFGPERTLCLEFMLPSGAYATSVLRELVRYTQADHPGEA